MITIMSWLGEDNLMEFDSLEGGDLVAASPSHLIPLGHLLLHLEKDVYYADVDYRKASDPGWSAITNPGSEGEFSRSRPNFIA
jgi:hypothetical protein